MSLRFTAAHVGGAVACKVVLVALALAAVMGSVGIADAVSTETPAYATPSSVVGAPSGDIDMSGQLEALMPDELPDAAAPLVEQYTGVSLDDGIGMILSATDAGGALKGAVAPAVTVLLILLLCGVFETVFPEGNASAVQLTGTLAITAAAGLNIGNLLTSGRGLIGTLDLTSKALLASLSAATGVMGAPVTAAAKYAASMLFSSLLISVIDKLLVPLVFAYVAVSAANAAIGGDALERMAKLLKWAASWTLGILLTAFVAYVTVTGIVTGGADALAVKTAKTVISGAVPIVGGIISDAAETVLASARLVRNAAGIAGLLAGIALCATPLLQLGAQYLLFRAAGAAGAPLASGRLSKLVEDIASAYALILAMVASSVFVMMISVVSMITITTG